MQRDGIMPSVVEDAIASGSRIPGNLPGTFVYSVSGLRVVAGEAGQVITIMPGNNQ
jgi:hypothetical protein